MWKNLHTIWDWCSRWESEYLKKEPILLWHSTTNQVQMNHQKEKNQYNACWEASSHAYLPMRFKHRKCSKPSCSWFLFRSNITPTIDRSSTVLPTRSFYNFCKTIPVAKIKSYTHIKQILKTWTSRQYTLFNK